MAEVKADGEVPGLIKRNSGIGSEEARAHVTGDVAEERDLGADLEDLDSDGPAGSLQVEIEEEMGPVRPLHTLQEREGVEAYPEMSQSSTSIEVEGSGSDADDTQRLEKVPAVPFKRRISMLNECRSVENYEKLNRISEGTYGVVYRYVNRYVCVKYKLPTDVMEMYVTILFTGRGISRQGKFVP